MRYVFRPSFDRSIKSLLTDQKNDLKALCFSFMELLEAHALIPAGMGLKRLHEDYWEIRHGLRDRILFRWKNDTVDFVLAGDHDSIKEFLKKC